MKLTNVQLEESMLANVRHAEVLSNVEDNFIAEVETLKNRERFSARQCEELRLEVLKKEEQLKLLQNQVSELKLALEFSDRSDDSQTESMKNDMENLTVHVSLINP
ncbi:hypothetical protein Y032_0040g256 [Ancylostoma ceylanicum]|uniref:Uncharacterized protein n=1 Tax=Ancylostoma ceylanicum TaxID=53326 RepID=A0A016UGR7_9BILA|nr:hypothetical protein Y032_0040g256 [Ancylostoma ceylanicum]